MLQENTLLGAKNISVNGINKSHAGHLEVAVKRHHRATSDILNTGFPPNPLATLILVL